MPAKLITFILLCLRDTQNLHQKEKKKERFSFLDSIHLFLPQFCFVSCAAEPWFPAGLLTLLGKYWDFLLMQLAGLYAYSPFFYHLENTWPKLMMDFSFGVSWKSNGRKICSMRGGRSEQLSAWGPPAGEGGPDSSRELPLRSQTPREASSSPHVPDLGTFFLPLSWISTKQAASAAFPGFPGTAPPSWWCTRCVQVAVASARFSKPTNLCPPRKFLITRSELSKSKYDSERITLR